MANEEFKQIAQTLNGYSKEEIGAAENIVNNSNQEAFSRSVSREHSIGENVTNVVAGQTLVDPSHQKGRE